MVLFSREKTKFGLNFKLYRLKRNAQKFSSSPYTRHEWEKKQTFKNLFI